VKRFLVIVLMLVSSTACATETARPEGIVERWLLALNQGSAGEPDHFAPAHVSDSILPGWEELGPGGFDVIEVGSRHRVMNVCDEGLTVPFRAVFLDGAEVSDAACVVGPRIVGLADLGTLPRRMFPSGGGPAIGEDRGSVWLIAVGVGLLILLVSEALMRLVGSTAHD
jgi:hypothetical protein